MANRACIVGRPWPPLEDRLWSRVDKARIGTGCWEWLGHRVAGYGRIYTDGRSHPVHRVVYALLVGPIPDGLVIDHLCRNRGCVNPDHLEPVPFMENVRRGKLSARAQDVYARARAQTHCKRGHPLSGDNLYRQGDNKRACQTCRRELSRQAYYRNRDKV